MHRGLGHGWGCWRGASAAGGLSPVDEGRPGPEGPISPHIWWVSEIGTSSSHCDCRAPGH